MQNRETQQSQILEEQVKQLYALAPLGFVATLVNSVIVFLVMKDATPLPVVSIWLAIILVITALRCVLVARFRRADLDRQNAATWSRRFTATVLLVGVAWGSIAAFPFSFSLAHQVFLAFVLGGMAAGASSTFSKVRHGFAAFSIPALAPLALHFFLIPDPFHHAMGAMTLLFLLLLWKISQLNYKVNRSSLLLRFENQEMIQSLKRAKDEMDGLNHRLMEEIEAKQEAEAELRLHQDQLERTVKERTADLVTTNDRLKNEIEERKQIEIALKQTQESLISAKNAAEAGSVAKSEFLANMSHEMRTPLAGTLGMIKLVLDMKITGEERELLGMAKRSSESLLRLIGDVLDFSRLEAGVLKFERKRFSVPETVRTAVEVVYLNAVEKGIELDYQVDESVREVVGDQGRLRQVLVNLLGNAVKFTERGRIDLAVERIGARQGEGKSFILFSVRDTGVGIPADQLERIFGKFTQLDSSLTRRYGGTGLGLALSRQIVEKSGGRIWAESCAGIGSTFHFTLPEERAGQDLQGPQ
jgi:signal transduction histidine kinase